MNSVICRGHRDVIPLWRMLLTGTLTLAVVLGTTSLPYARAQTPGGTHPDSTASQPLESQQFDREFNEILDSVRKKTGDRWEASAALSASLVEQFYRHQGWMSESDQFARKFDIEVVRIPPWKPQERFAMVIDLLRERYQLTDEQAARVQRAFALGIMEISVKHAGTLLAFGKEYVEAGGLSGTDADAENIARWLNMLQPVLQDALALTRKRASEIISTLDDRQRQIAQRDLDANDRRVADCQALLSKWAAGRWRLEDAGLTPDMFRMEWVNGLLEREHAAAGQGSGPSSTAEALHKADSDNPDAWTLYVQGFVRKYSLDATQRATAYGVLKELRGRAVEYFTSHRADLQDLDKRAGKATPDEKVRIGRERDGLTQPIALMFQELKDRLEVLPTDAQRAAGASSSQPPERAVTTRPASTSSRVAQITSPASQHALTGH